LKHTAASCGESLTGGFNIAPQCLLNAQGRRFFENLALPHASGIDDWWGKDISIEGAVLTA
jgi:hypothetical protein